MWSPYYRIVAKQFDLGDGEAGLNVQVNGVPHQVARSVEGRLRDDPLYGVAYDRVVHGAPGKVLVVGAGTGNDVALALAKGATHVDAVEIDPKILDLGRRLPPGSTLRRPASDDSRRRREGIPGANRTIAMTSFSSRSPTRSLW